MKIPFLFLALLPALSLADVNIYGNLKSGITTSHITLSNRNINQTSVDDVGSYVGISGSHSISNSSESHLIWQMEENTPVSHRGPTLHDYFRSKKENGILLPSNN